MSRRPRGVAIVLAMAVVLMASLAATALLVSQSTWSRRLQLETDHAQARGAMQAGLDWARAVLGDDRRIGDADHAGEPWALQLPPLPVENGTLVGRLVDEQGKFNVNNVAREGRIDPTELQRLRRLLKLLELPVSLAEALAGAIEGDNPPLTDLDELVLLRGFDAAVRERLRPFVTALPRHTAINVNTASPEVLSAVVEGLDLDHARALVAQRRRLFFREPADFLRSLPAGANLAPESLAIGSDFFLATMTVTVGDARARGSALLNRATPGWPAIVWRKYP